MVHVSKHNELAQCQEVNSRLHLDFASFSTNVLFLQHDPTRGTMLHLVVMSPHVNPSGLKVPPSFLVFHEPDSLKKFSFNILDNVLYSGHGSCYFPA